MKKTRSCKWEQVAFLLKHPLHTRPAAQLARIAQPFNADIEVGCGKQKGNGKSVLSLLALGAEAGMGLSFRARGPEAREALKALSRFLKEEMA